MEDKKIKKAIDAIGLPRLIVFLFFSAVVITAYVKGIDVVSYLASTVKYWGMWAILVLAMVPTIKCGIGPNFGISLGIVCGLLGTLLAIEFDIAKKVNSVAKGLGPWAAFAFAVLIAVLVAWLVGVGYGKLLNMVKVPK